MKRLFSTLCIAGALACVCSCGTARKAAATIDALDGEWRIVEVEGQALSPKAGEKEAGSARYYRGRPAGRRQEGHHIVRPGGQHADDVRRHGDRAEGAGRHGQGREIRDIGRRDDDPGNGRRQGGDDAPQEIGAAIRPEGQGGMNLDGARRGGRLRGGAPGGDFIPPWLFKAV